MRLGVVEAIPLDSASVFDGEHVGESVAFEARPDEHGTEFPGLFGAFYGFNAHAPAARESLPVEQVVGNDGGSGEIRFHKTHSATPSLAPSPRAFRKARRAFRVATVPPCHAGTFPCCHSPAGFEQIARDAPFSQFKKNLCPYALFFVRMT